jgi:Predicted integral membrane protein (DUF2269)
MEWLGTLFLYLHIGGVLVAFGPTIAFPILAARAAKEPMHGNFVLRASESITERVVEPGAVFVLLMGVGLIVTRGYSLVDDLWVTVSIVLLLITLAFSYFVQLRVLRRMVELTSMPPAPAGAGPGAPSAAGPAPAGPPPEFLELSARAARGGMFMTVMLFTILALMVVKPF